MRIGARIVKTGIAVTITLFVCRALGLKPALFGAIKAVVNMQPTVYLTLTAVRNQVLVLALGIAVGLACVVGANPLTAGAATIAIIALARRLELESGLLMGIVAALFRLVLAVLESGRATMLRGVQSPRRRNTSLKTAAGRTYASSASCRRRGTSKTALKGTSSDFSRDGPLSNR